MGRCTIIIPTHNRAVLLERAVGSALASCTQDGEVLVVDDKSDVPAAQVLAHLEDTRLKITVNPGPSGAASARNWGASQAEGELLFFLDDDDEMCADYCDRVLRGGGEVVEWGFSSTIERFGAETTADRPRLRRRLQRGQVAAAGPVKDRIAAVSDGFWIRRALFNQLGGFAAIRSSTKTPTCACG